MGLSRATFRHAMFLVLFLSASVGLAQTSDDVVLFEREDGQYFLLRVNNQMSFTTDFHGKKTFPDLEYLYDNFLPDLKSACYSGIETDDQVTGPKLLAQFRIITSQRRRELKQHAAYLRAPSQTPTSFRRLPFLLEFSALQPEIIDAGNGTQEARVGVSYKVINLTNSATTQKDISVVKCKGKKKSLVTAFMNAQSGSVGNQ